MDRLIFRFIALIGCVFVFAFTSCKRDCDCDIDKPNAFTVLFNSNGGSKVWLQKVKEGEKVIQPDDPKREGFIFDAWFRNIELVHQWNFETDSVFSDITLYANWMEEPDIINSILYGRWKLMKTEKSPYLPPFTFDHSMYDIVFEFQSNGILTVTGVPDTIVKYPLMEKDKFNYCYRISQFTMRFLHYDIEAFIGFDDQCGNQKYEHSLFLSSKTDPLEMAIINSVPFGDLILGPRYFFSKIK